jgi:hypothetical protein
MTAEKALLVTLGIIGACAVLYAIAACIGAYVVTQIRRRLEQDERRARIQAEVEL